MGELTLPPTIAKQMKKKRQNTLLDQKRNNIVSSAEEKKKAMQEAYDRIQSAPGFQAVQKEELPTGPSDQFRVIRDRVANRQANAGKEMQEAMRRRLAASGVLDSGAGLEALRVAQEKHNMSTEDALQGVDAQEMADRAQREEAIKQRNAAREQFNEQSKMQENAYRMESLAKLKQLEIGIDEVTSERLKIDLAENESEFNKKLEEWKANQSQRGFFDNLFGGGQTFGEFYRGY